MSAAKDTSTSTRQPPAAPPFPVGVTVNSSLPQAQFEEGRALFNKGLASYPRAAELFGTAADAGHAVATAWLAHCYWIGDGVEESKDEGGRLARLALDERGLQSLADQGDALAQHALGVMHARGRGVAKDAREAVAWWRKSAEQGYAEAQCALGFTTTAAVKAWTRTTARQRSGGASPRSKDTQWPSVASALLTTTAKAWTRI